MVTVITSYNTTINNNNNNANINNDNNDREGLIVHHRVRHAAGHQRHDLVGGLEAHGLHAGRGDEQLRGTGHCLEDMMLVHCYD